MLKGTLAVIALSLLALYAAALAWLWFRQESILFYPAPLPAQHKFNAGADVQELTVDVDGAKLSVLHLKLPAPKGVVFFLHGNAGNLDTWFTNAALYREANFDLVMPDYRGYGKSTGHIASEAQLRKDVRAVWDRIAPMYQGKKLVIYGRSLGTALASGLAHQIAAEGRKPDLLVLVSPYTSMRNMAREFYAWVPAALVRYQLDTASVLPQVPGAILLVHGGNDTLIREHHPRQLQQLVPSAQLLVVPGAEHNDIHQFPLYREQFLKALAQL